MRCARLMVCLAAAMAAGRADAQFRVGDEGRALDANPMIGSGGYNAPGAAYMQPQRVTGNQIVTGNVTDFKAFRGNISYTDPREFRGRQGSTTFDRFYRDSSGIPQAYQPATTVRDPEAFYGNALVGAPPANFAETGQTGTYTVRPVAETPVSSFTRQLRSSLLVSDPLLAPRVGEIPVIDANDLQSNTPEPFGGPATPGFQVFGRGDPNMRPFLSNMRGPNIETALSRLRLDPNAIQKMRDEVNRSADLTTGDNTDPNTPKDMNLSRPMPTPFDAPETVKVGGNILGADMTPKPLLGDVRPTGELRWNVPTAPAAKQSSQYAELQRRLDRYYIARLQTDEDRHRDILRQLRDKEAAEKASPAIGSAKRPAAAPDYGRAKREVLKLPDRIVGPATRPAPLKITSLAAGVHAEGLANLLRRAERLMGEGQYVSALDCYQAAAQVAANNGIVALGQTNAELAAGYYKRAELHLRQAFANDPVLTMAMFDLKAMIGEARVKAVITDLRDTAIVQPADPGPPLLLAYLLYNSGNESQAAGYLKTAERLDHADNRDLYKLLHTHWLLPTGQ